MISDIELDEMIKSCNDSLIACRNSCYKVAEALKELKERRESSLRPATKFVNENSMFIQMNQISQEFREVTREVAAIFNEAGNCENLIMELVDLQTACETMLAILGLDESQRQEARRKVIAKNQSRGYYCE